MLPTSSPFRQSPVLCLMDSEVVCNMSHTKKDSTDGGWQVPQHLAQQRDCALGPQGTRCRGIQGLGRSKAARSTVDNRNSCSGPSGNTQILFSLAVASDCQTSGQKSGDEKSVGLQ